MELLSKLLNTTLTLVPTAVAVAGVVVVLYVANRLLERRKRLAEGHRFRNQMIMVGLTFVGVLVVIMVLPIGDTLRGQLLSLLGILLSAAIALSSTTILGNALGGLMLRVIRNFRAGDFIRVDGYFGRVSERGLFHTEIQTEERELITLPNLYLVTHAVTTIRSSGTLITANVSLGYDVPRPRVEELLRQAAEASGLEEPFVHVTELGDFSVSYRVAGLLTEVKQYISARARLRSAMMDALHGGGVEIVSPNFMNTRAFAPEKRFVPKRTVVEPETVAPAVVPEELVFDKAEEAESREAIQQTHDKLVAEIKSLKDRIEETEDESAAARLKTQLERLEARKESLAQAVESAESAAGEGAKSG